LQSLAAVLLFTIRAAAQTNPPQAFYLRSYLTDIPSQPLVTVTVSGASNVSCFTIEETLPAPATALDVSGDGVYLPVQNVIRWGPYFNTVTTNVTYRLAGLPADYTIDGGSWMDGRWYFSAGASTITVLTAGTNTLSPPPRVATPVFAPASGTNVPVTVTISDATTNAAIHYTLDGTLPTQSSALYSNGIALSAPSVVRALAFADGYVPSTPSAAFYGPPAATGDVQVARTIVTNSPGTPVVMLSITPGSNATCVAVTEALPPGLAVANISSGGSYIGTNNTILWGPFFGTNAQTLSYQAAGTPAAYPVQASWSVDGMGGAEAAQAYLVIASSNGMPTPPPQVAAPVFTPGSGSNVPVNVTIACATTNAAIYYTLDGSLPNQSSTPYSSSIALTSASLIRSRAFMDGYTPSADSAAYYGPPAAAPNAQVTRSVSTNSAGAPLVAFNFVPGVGASCVTVTETLPPGLAATSVSAGGSYLASNSVVLWGPFFGTNALLLSYQPAGRPGLYSAQATWSVDGVGGGEAAPVNLVINGGPGGGIPTPPPQEPVPTVSPASASNLPATVSITSIDPQAQIYYTTDGSVPGQSSTPYTGALTFSTKTTLRARAFRSGYLASDSALGEYNSPLTTNSLLLARSIARDGSFLPTVSVSAIPRGNLSCYTVTETVVPGLTPSGLSGDAAWNPVTGAINWGPYFDNQPRILTYNVTGPSGSYPLSGQGSFDGYTVVNGATAANINHAYFGPSPTNELACTGEPLDYTVAVNPAPGVITVTSASGSVDWGDGTQSALTQPVMTFEKQYTSAGSYTVTISADWSGIGPSGQFFGHATQLNAIQVLTNCYPVITSGPSNQTVLAGGAAQFSVSVSSPYPVSYQWYFNQMFRIQGPFLGTLTLPDVGGQQAGLYSVVVTNAHGSATSSAATLTVIEPLVTGVTRNADGSVTLSFVGLPNSTTRVWAATSLVPPIFWQPIYTNSNTSATGAWQFTDTNATNYPARFYRFSTP
jgi:hypothetical protein